MGNNTISLLVGAFVGTYLNNPKFRAQVDSGLREIVGKGVDALNNAGGGANVPRPVASEPEE